MCSFCKDILTVNRRPFVTCQEVIRKTAIVDERGKGTRKVVIREKRVLLRFQREAWYGGSVRALWSCGAAVHLHEMMSLVSGHGSSFYIQ